MITIQDVVSSVQEVLMNKGCQVDHIDATTLLRDLELDSLDIAEMLIILEEKAGGELDPHSISSLEQISDITRLKLR